MGERTPATEIEDDGRRHHGHDVGHLRADSHPESATFEFGHGPVGGGEAVGAPTGQADGMYPVDEIPRIEGVGLTRSGATTAHVDRCDGAIGHADHRRARSPPATATLVMTDEYAVDVGQ